VFAFSFNAKSQTNFGLFVGGGLSIPKITYYGFDTTSFIPKVIRENDTISGIGYGTDVSKRMYNFGMNFENVLVERMFYLEFGLQAMSRGYKYSDELYVSSHGIHIPLTFKYKYFFNKRTENYLSANIGFFGSAYYYGYEYNKKELDAIALNPSLDEDYDPNIKFGKILIDPKAEMSTFDYGSVGGIGIGLFGHLHINYNFGYSWTVYKIEPVGKLMTDSHLGYHNLYYHNTFHIFTVGYYFSNEYLKVC
jgi:hypothetical protein